MTIYLDGIHAKEQCDDSDIALWYFVYDGYSYLLRFSPPEGGLSKVTLSLKKLRRVKLLMKLQSPSQSYGMSLAMWDHTVLPATRHKWTHPDLTPARQAGTRFTYPEGMGGWVDLGDRLHTEMVYSPIDAIRVLTRQCTVWSRTRDLLITSLTTTPPSHQSL